MGRLIRWQAAVTLAMAAVAACWFGWAGVIAACMGGGANLLAAATFMVRTALLPPDATPQARLAAMVRAEAVEWGASIGLFTAAATLVPKQFLVVIAAFVATTGVYWFALLWDVPDDRPKGVD